VTPEKFSGFIDSIFSLIALNPTKTAISPNATKSIKRVNNSIAIPEIKAIFL